MRMKADPLNETEVHQMPDGGTMTVTPDGTTTLGTSTFEVRRLVFEHPGANPRTETHLVGKRGSVYMLRPYLERKGDSGIRQVISFNTGAPLRQKGNEVKAIEIAGVIEQYHAPRHSMG